MSLFDEAHTSSYSPSITVSGKMVPQCFASSIVKF